MTIDFSNTLNRIGGILITVFCCYGATLFAEPLIIKGKYLEKLLGTPIAALRVSCDRSGALPFQIDEVDSSGEFICDMGASPNTASANGVLDTADEIVFLREDIRLHTAGDKSPGGTVCTVNVGGTTALYLVYISNDKNIPLSEKKYVTYDHSKQLLSTPYYYAQFARDRFHFTRAGIFDEQDRKWVHLTRQLSVSIYLKALWGMLPLRYTEDNLVCYVKRYRTGPIRCIRRGDFHLNLGLGIKGSRAIVYQCCYPHMVSVPVNVSIPVKFRYLFSTAWLEMAPVIDTCGRSFMFNVPDCGTTIALGTPSFPDTIIQCQPLDRLFTVDNGRNGYGWMLSTSINRAALQGSGFVIRKKDDCAGCMSSCGYRLEIRDVERGKYRILNRVLFAAEKGQSVRELADALRYPARITVGTTVSFINNLD